MSDKPPESELSEEFRRLGENLKQAAAAAWDSPEGQRLRSEINAGMRALERGINEAASSETGQKLKADVEDFSARVQSGQVEKQLRSDLLAALRTINSHLDDATRKARGGGTV